MNRWRMETFTFAPNWGMKLSKEPKVKTITFGDGYEQRLKQGLNHNLRSYSLTFSGDINQMQQIEAFLDRHEGYKAFLWSPYHSTQGKFKCSKWDIEQKESHWTISCEFKEVVA